MASLLRNNLDAIFQVDRDGQFLACNPAAETLCGYSESELHGRSFVPLIVPKELGALREAIARAVEGEPQCHETSLLHRDGPRIELQLTLVPVAVDGKIDGLYIVARDITERRITMNALSSSEERYRAFIANSSEGIWRFELEWPIPVGRDADEHIDHFFRYAYLAECNDAFARMYGFESAHEVNGCRLADFMALDDQNNTEYLKQFVRSGYRLMDAESHEYDRFGNDCYFLNNLTGLVQDGLLIRAWGTQRDITERRRSEKNQEFLMAASIAVSASLNVETNLQNIAALAVPDFAALCVVVLDGDRPPHVLDLRCKDPEIELSLRAASSLNDDHSHAESGLRMWPETMRVLKQGRTEFYPVWQFGKKPLTESPGAHREERNHWLEQLDVRSCICVPMTAAGMTLGAILFASSVGRTYDERDLALAEDIGRRAATSVQNAQLLRAAQEAQRSAETARQQAEQARRQAEKARLEAEEAQREAEEANRAKDEFLAMVSHELRTPLTPVLGWVHLLRNTGLEPAQANTALEAVERNTRAQAQIVNDLLDISRMVTGKLQLHLEETEVGNVIESAAESLRLTAEQKKLQLLIDCRDLGTLRCDADRMQQVVWNLLSNAIKFTPEGGWIRLLAHNDGDWTCIEVRDNGSGIAPEFLPYVFERFRQGDTASTRRHGGLGLGLSIVHHIVELHGGSIAVYSDGLSEGTTFEVRLPRREGLPRRESLGREDAKNENSVSERENAPSVVAPQPPLQDLRVLVVDDEEDTRDLIAAVLTQSGARVRSAQSAARAFELLQEQTPDLILSDIAMPEEDGLSLLRRVRESGYCGPIIALTARARAEDRILSLESGFNEHLTKPIEPRYLVQTVADLMQCDEDH